MLSIAFDLAGAWPNVVAIGLVIALVSIANQSVFTAGQLWIARDAEPGLRTSLISFGQLVINAGLVGMGLALGLIAQDHDAVWPVMIVLLLNLTAAYSATRFAPDRPSGRPYRRLDAESAEHAAMEHNGRYVGIHLDLVDP